MKLRYFAWVRERIGHAEDEIDLPRGIVTVGELVRWLATQGEEYAYALERPEVIRVAIDQVHVTPDTPIGTAQEIALFPPMTGG